MSDSIELVRIEDSGDNTRFCKLFKKCFRQDKASEYFDWKYFNNPSGEFIGFEAKHKGKTVASYGMVPEDYLVDGKSVKYFQAADAMVSPRYWGKDLFNLIATKVQDVIFDLYENSVMIGFPGHWSVAELTNRLGWQFVNKECNYIFTNKALTRISSIAKKSGNAEFKTIKELTSEVSSFLDNYHQLNRDGRRDFSSAQFNWKVFERPDQQYNVESISRDSEVVGLYVSRVDTSKSAELCWAVFNKIEDYSLLPFVSKRIFEKEKVKYISSWEPFEDSMRSRFKKAGFIKNSLKKGPYAFTFPYVINKSDSNSVTMNSHSLMPLCLDN